MYFRRVLVLAALASFLVVVAKPVGRMCDKSKKTSLVSRDNVFINSRLNCPVKVCKDVVRHQNITRNPHTIVKIFCVSEKGNCYQAYVKMNVTYYRNGMEEHTQQEKVPIGCIYSDKLPFKTQDVEPTRARSRPVQ